MLQAKVLTNEHYRLSIATSEMNNQLNAAANERWILTSPVTLQIRDTLYILVATVTKNFTP